MGSAACVHLPAKREYDAVRFQIARGESGRLRVQFACERDHRPALCGELSYDRAAGNWIVPPDERLISLAGAAVRAWIERYGAARKV
jgi:hypothetical protein